MRIFADKPPNFRWKTPLYDNIHHHKLLVESESARSMCNVLSTRMQFLSDYCEFQCTLMYIVVRKL